jgi:hypothetical protein
LEAAGQWASTFSSKPTSSAEQAARPSPAAGLIAIPCGRVATAVFRVEVASSASIPVGAAASGLVGLTVSFGAKASLPQPVICGKGIVSLLGAPGIW